MAMKKCNRCGETKPYSEFHKHNQLKDGYRGTCKVCRRPELAGNERHKQRQREWYQENKAKRRNDILMKLYGIDSIEYQKLFNHQGGVCAICERPPTNKSLAVDHCHTTGAVRGLLCGPCNQAIGLLGDSCDTLRVALNYLEVKSNDEEDNC